jgi:hypothetical protein
MPNVTVTLSNKKIAVDKATVEASVSKGERVEWNCTDGPFEITFKPGSNWPDPPAAREKDGVWSTASGPFNRPNTRLQYNVAAVDHDTLDPDIDIRP